MMCGTYFLFPRLAKYFSKYLKNLPFRRGSLVDVLAYTSLD